MSLFSPIAMAEAVAGQGVFERALSAADDVVEALIVFEDHTAGRSGLFVPPTAAPLTVAMHSAAPPRARCCRVGLWSDRAAYDAARAARAAIDAAGAITYDAVSVARAAQVEKLIQITKEGEQ